ncbi:hypothetical protein M0R45_021055 [Rubus argutus]|uniref:Uncharacterized protein n=1 Tax=Rubus argutus TaxID=59490 RepID=A0AAW1XB61_RUBAR
MVSGTVSPAVAISQFGYVDNIVPPSTAMVTNTGFPNTHVMPGSTSYHSAYNTAALVNNGSSVPSSSSVMNPVPSSTYMVPNVSNNGVINAATQSGVGGYMSTPPQYNNFTAQSTARAYFQPSCFNAQNDGGMQVHYGCFQQL